MKLILIQFDQNILKAAGLTNHLQGMLPSTSEAVYSGSRVGEVQIFI